MAASASPLRQVGSISIYTGFNCKLESSFIDWKNVLSEVSKTKCEIFALEHDDPKDYKEYTTKSLEYLEKI